MAKNKKRPGYEELHIVWPEELITALKLMKADMMFDSLSGTIRFCARDALVTRGYMVGLKENAQRPELTP